MSLLLLSGTSQFNGPAICIQGMVVNNVASVENGNLGRSLPAATGFGLGMGALITTIFGFFWLGWGFSAAPILTATQWIVFYVVTLTLVAAAIVTLRTGKARMKAHSAQRDEFWAVAGKWYRISLMGEGVGCAAVVLLTLIFHRLDLLPVGISLVVGIHFLPMAGLFRFAAYHIAGTVIILCDLLIWAILKSDAITIAVGIATGAILWMTAIYALIRARKVLRDAPTH